MNTPANPKLHELRPELEALANTNGNGHADTFQLLTISDLLNAPPPAWVIDEVLPEGLAVLHGAPGTFKSFVALAWALHIAAGTPWLDHPTRGGWVVYIAAEGRGGIGRRIGAWLTAHGLADVPKFRLLADTVNLNDFGQVERARNTLKALPEPPRLLVVDTMARSMPGGDENAARDVGTLVANVDKLRGTGTALIVHHDRKDGAGERGSGSLRGAADLMVAVERKPASDYVQLKNTKSKEAAEWAPIRLAAREVGDSLVLEHDTDAAGPDDTFRPTTLMERVSRAIEATPGLTKNAIRGAVTGKGKTVDLATDILFSEDYITRKRQGQAYLHYSAKPYRVPSSQPCPTASQDEVVNNRVPVSPPKGTRDGTRSGGDGQQHFTGATVSPPKRAPEPLTFGNVNHTEQEGLS
jgi:hypothetical protein